MSIHHFFLYKNLKEQTTNETISKVVHYRPIKEGLFSKHDKFMKDKCVQICQAQMQIKSRM